MFDQQQYINHYIKDNYKTLKIRIRKDDPLIIEKLSDVDNINKYILSLIIKDICSHHTYNFINNDVPIDFELSATMKDLVEEAEKADVLNDYGLYMNIADAIDSQGKKETTQNIISEGQWRQLTKRYCL